jgi:hypothetical protein
MVLTSTTMQDINDAVKTNLIASMTNFSFGTGTTPESISDTNLQALLVTKARQEYSDLSNIIIVSGYLGSSEQNGNIIAEVGTKTSGGSLKSRKVIDSITKTSGNELWVDNQVEIAVTQESL